MKTPFLNATLKASRLQTRFFVPGHKANKQALPPFASLLCEDLTEICGLDDLAAPSGPLKKSQENMALAFGAGATLYSAFGCSTCILAMLGLFVGQGGQVVMARGAHIAAVRALALFNITAHWLPLCGGVPTPKDVELALKQTDAKAVYVTSVNYFGNMADIAAIASVCKRHGAALLCDNAHGAYLRFMPQNLHPLALGASACADSAHKTLFCLTPAAMLHLKDAKKAAAAREMLNLFSSTSPAYPVLASLDYTAGLLLKSPPNFAACAQRLLKIEGDFAQIAQPCKDFLRLHLRPILAGYNPAHFLKCLQNQQIYEEFFDGDSIIFMASPANTEEDFVLLEKALANAVQTLPQSRAPAKKTLQSPWEALPLPQVFCSVHSALFCKKKQRINTKNAPGRVMAGFFCPCPPGVPLVLPGEYICQKTAQYMLNSGILQVDVLE